MHIVKENGTLVMDAEEKQMFSGLQLKIMKSLAEGEKYPKEMARELRKTSRKFIIISGS